MFKRGSAAALASLSGAVICRPGGATGASGPTGGWGRPALGGARHNDLVGLWSLGGPSAEAVTSKTKTGTFNDWGGGDVTYLSPFLEGTARK